MSSLLLSNDDVLHRIIEFLGPRHSCIGIGAVCKDLRRTSKCNSIWRSFWRRRCLFPSEQTAAKHATMSTGVHKAALVWRRAIQEMGIGDMIESASCNTPIAINSGEDGPMLSRSEYVEDCLETTLSQRHWLNNLSEEHSMLLYTAYIQQHFLMQQADLRIWPFGRREEHPRANGNAGEKSVLQCPPCSQTWPGQLSLVTGTGGLEGDEDHVVTCENSAEVWCDYPDCHEARCGPQGCLRCYRFLPHNYQLSADGQMVRQECTERNYDFVSFVKKCSWCSVSFCNEHLDRCYQDRRTKDNDHGARNSPLWYKCDECGLSSCLDCVSQVFVSPPDMSGCSVVTAGKACRRNACSNCIWYVGKRKKYVSGNIPGDTRKPEQSADVITVKGADALKTRRDEWEEIETCCSKCLRHVEFRLKELAQVQDTFGLWGIMP